MKHENSRHKKIENHNHEHEHENNSGLFGTERLKALISHWIEHNTGHLEKIRENAELAEEEGASEVAKHLNDAVTHMQKAIDSLELALKTIT
ncbi:MAG: hypothetical protein WED07_09225 [Candidatus Freyarchaeum deiterrae]